jgi:predicted DNA-binding transcriptional regulator YafY
MNVRTAYRDLSALDSKVGVKVWQDGHRYGAEQSSFLPPLKLGVYEAVTLFLSARLMQRRQDHRDPHVISDFDKLATVLPSPIAQHVPATVAWLNELPSDDPRARSFDLIAAAWAAGRRVKIHYAHNRHLNERLIAPYLFEPNLGHLRRRHRPRPSPFSRCVRDATGARNQLAPLPACLSCAG